MHIVNPVKPLPVHDDLWQQFELIRSKNRLGHALLLIGSPPAQLIALACRMATAILCKHESSPCGQCQSCQLTRKNEHPDFHFLVPEKAGTVIKIEQIRQLQAMITTAPQLGRNRVILISPAEKLNVAAANALLKILEEPADNTCFILLAEQISTLSATIISRCQQWRSTSLERLQDDYLTQQDLYPAEEGRGLVLAAVETIIHQLLELHEEKTSVNALAQSWSLYPFADLIWVLYLLNAQMVQINLLGFNARASGIANFPQLINKIKPIRLFAQLDKLHEIIAKINHTFSMNQQLVLEDFLLGYTLCR